MCKKNIKRTLIWLDDIRDPFGDYSEWVQKYAPDFDGVIIWVKSYCEFTQWITDNGLPYKISFDHDLADEHYAPKEHWDEKYNDWASSQNFVEKTGYDCAKWLVGYCIDNDDELPFGLVIVRIQ